MAEEEETLSQALRRAEEVYALQMELDAKLREGFVSISGARAMAGRSVVFTSLTWPSSDSARVKVKRGEDGLWGIIEARNSDDNNKQTLLRSWCGPSGERDAANAQLAFSSALAVALQLLNHLEKKRENSN